MYFSWYFVTVLSPTLSGDFNFGDGVEDDSIDWGDYKDAWKTLYPSDPGFTFDPSTNVLAKLTSRSGIPRRLDRILIRSDFIHPTVMKMVGTDSFTFEITCAEAERMEGRTLQEEELKRLNLVTLPPSDHYGLLCLLKLE